MRTKAIALRVMYMMDMYGMMMCRYKLCCSSR